jgi:hypothetical protein
VISDCQVELQVSNTVTDHRNGMSKIFFLYFGEEGVKRECIETVSKLLFNKRST